MTEQSSPSPLPETRSCAAFWSLKMAYSVPDTVCASFHSFLTPFCASCVLWKSLGQLCIKAALGNEPRRVLDELSEIHSMDVILPTKFGLEIRTRCVSKPTDHQQILLDKQGGNLPTKINLKQM